MRALVTVAPLLAHPGAVPAEPFGRALVSELLRRDVAARVLAGPSTGDWPDGVEHVRGCITRWEETPDGVHPLAGGPWVSRIARRQPVRVPYAEAGVPLIHERDLAEAAAHVLLGDRFDGLRDAAGLPIVLEDLSVEEAPAVLGASGMQEHDVEHLLTTLRWFSEHEEPCTPGLPSGPCPSSPCSPASCGAPRISSRAP